MSYTNLIGCTSRTFSRTKLLFFVLPRPAAASSAFSTKITMRSKTVEQSFTVNRHFRLVHNRHFTTSLYGVSTKTSSSSSMASKRFMKALPRLLNSYPWERAQPKNWSRLFGLASPVKAFSSCTSFCFSSLA
jgi:hypothetical protein